MITLPNPSAYLPDLLGARQPPRPRCVNLTAIADGTQRRVIINDNGTITRSAPASTWQSALFTVPSGFVGRIDSFVSSNPNSGLATAPRIINDASIGFRSGNWVSNATASSYPSTATGYPRTDGDFYSHAVCPLIEGDQIGFTDPASLVDGFTAHQQLLLWPTTHAVATRHANIASATPTIIYTVPSGKIATLASAGIGRDFSCTRFSFTGGTTHRVNFYLLDAGEGTAQCTGNRLIHYLLASGNNFAQPLPFRLTLRAGQSLAAEHISGPTTNNLRSLWHLEDA